jgi:hypothetical protein
MSKLLLGGAAGAGLLGYLAYKAKRGHVRRLFAPKTLGLTSAQSDAPPPMVPVQSSMIKAIGYADGAGDLVVKFNDGKTYTFKKVPPAMFKKLMAAGSKGESFNKMIKNKYEHEKTGAAEDPFDRITPPTPKKTLSEMLVDLRSLDTPEKWNAYVDRYHNPRAEQRPVLEASRRGGHGGRGRSRGRR